MKPEVYDCIASIVVFDTEEKILNKAILSFLNTKLKVKLYIINTGSFNYHLPEDERIELIHTKGVNLGYGKGNNLALEISEDSKYFLILNPDLFIIDDALEKLIQFMDKNLTIGIVIPKVLNEDGSIQYLNKRHPAIFPLFIRRFVPVKFHSLFKKILDEYEMKDFNYEENFEVPFISGAFMLTRKKNLLEIGGFDSRYFMYFEDADLSRKFQEAGFKTMYYSKAKVIHVWKRGAHKSKKLALIFISSMWKYFRKWGFRIFLSSE